MLNETKNASNTLPFAVSKTSLVDVELDAITQRFLGVLKPSTAKTYRPAFKYFELFSKEYAVSGSGAQYVFKGVYGFLKLLSEDRKRDPLEVVHPEQTILRDFAAWLSDPKRDLKSKSVVDYVRVLGSISEDRGMSIDFSKIQLPRSQVTSEKYSWTLEKFSQFVSSMDLKYQALFVFMLQSGMDGDAYALKYGTIKKEFEAGITPMALFPENGFCYREKTGVKYRTFVGALTVRLLKKYLAGRTLSEADLVFDFSQRAAQAYIRRKAIKFFGSFEGTNPYRAHGFRDTFLKQAVDVGHVPDPDYAEWMMDHDIGVKGAYICDKSPEEWRQIYKTYFEPVLTFNFKIAECSPSRLGCSVKGRRLA